MINICIILLPYLDEKNIIYGDLHLEASYLSPSSTPSLTLPFIYIDS